MRIHILSPQFKPPTETYTDIQQKLEGHRLLMDSPQQQQIIDLYRKFHQTPELGLAEFKTTQLIQNCIENCKGAEILQPHFDTPLKTGLIAVVRAITPHYPAYLFRCDIDALKLQEESGVPYSSQNGFHHACGHDAHTAMLLTALRLIALRKETLKRDIYFCFQPGEEGCGGASKLLEKYGGLPNGVAMCFAMHVGNHKLKGAFMIPEKEATANSSLVRIQVTGKKAHCILPHVGVDANFIGCQIANEIYSVRSRIISPQTLMTIAVIYMEGGRQRGTAISDHMTISASMRSFSRETHQKVLGHIEKYTKMLCEVNGAQYTFEDLNNNHYRVVKNDPSAITVVKWAAESLFQNVEWIKASFSGEDFCEFSERKPSCYFMLGVGLEGSLDEHTRESKFPIHSNKFKLDETALLRGAKLWERIAMFEGPSIQPQHGSINQQIK